MVSSSEIDGQAVKVLLDLYIRKTLILVAKSGPELPKNGTLRPLTKCKDLHQLTGSAVLVGRGTLHHPCKYRP